MGRCLLLAADLSSGEQDQAVMMVGPRGVPLTPIP
jgi:hypothetical protein